MTATVRTGGGRGMARATTSYSGIFGGLVIWGLAPERAMKLAEQRVDGAICPRASVALEWYVRIWDMIDAGINALGGARAREAWRLLYREHRPHSVAGRSLGYTERTIHENNERDVARLKAQVDMAELERLLAWRVTFRKMTGLSFAQEMRGFELDEGAPRVTERKGRKSYSRVVDWREVARVTDDPKHALDAEALRKGWARDG